MVDGRALYCRQSLWLMGAMVCCCSGGDKSDSDYMGMDGGPATPRTPADADADGYMDMLPSWGDATCPEAAAAAAAAAATLTSSTSSGHETDEGAYFDMTAPASHPLATVQEKFGEAPARHPLTVA